MTAGMDGVMPDGYDPRFQARIQANAAQSSGMLAGPLPGADPLGRGLGDGVPDPRFFDPAMNAPNGVGMMPGFDGNDAGSMPGMMDSPTRHRVRPAARDRASRSRQPARKPAKKPSSAGAKRSNSAQSKNR
jgi:hypothetical protein